MHHCQHCNEIVEKNYCSNCGQKKNDGTISLKDISQYLAQEVFTLESKLLKTIKCLMFKPGHLAWDFIRGNRSNYYNPIKYFILMGTLAILLRFLLDYDPVIVGVNSISSESVNNEKLEKVISVGQILVQNNTYVIIINLLILAFFAKALNFKNSIKIIEYIILFFFLLGQQFLFTSFFTILTVFDDKFFYLSLLTQLPYLAFGLTQFVRKKNMLSIMKNVFTVFISFFITMILFAIGIVFYIR